ncbi:DedA family protein [Paenibacillus sp. KN14-4R]|uniref:DedA family protein n=1 Tax=Paenibacillus sp. KN14-4R TaxID=3445773 RepID=UPI003FA11036
MQFIENLFHQHGYFVLFFGLLLEFIALPFPGETTMAFSGFLSYEGVFRWEVLVLFAFLGTTIGMTITYFIGYFVGMPFVRKYGKWVLLSPDKIDKTKIWFDKYGYTLIFIGYFIPGVRHFTGYFSGIVRLPFRKFALTAYTGALFWVVLFIWIGKLFGPQWRAMFELFERYAKFGIIILVVFILLYLSIRFRKQLHIWIKYLVKGKDSDSMNK